MSNERNVNQLLDVAARCAHTFVENQFKQVVLLHHNDCDGLSSGSILSRAFERQHLKILRYCLEKPYPEVLAEIFDNPLLEEQCAFVFVDFASGMLSIIEDLNKAKKAVFVIDHHQIESAYNNGAIAQHKELTLLNCRPHGVDGSKECSASALAYLFAIALDSNNTDLLPMALLGALGDHQYHDKFKFSGLNQQNYLAALQAGLIDQQSNFLVPHNRSAAEFVSAVNALGSLAYFSKGPDIALKGLAEGFDQRYLDIAKQYSDKFDEFYRKFAENLKLNQANRVQWFILPDDFAEYGVKTVGLVCEKLIEHGLVQSDKIVAGFQKIPNQIPGLANIEFNQYKVSLRLPKLLIERLKQTPQAGLDHILPQAIHQLAGFVDACHPHAAAATVKIGQELLLIDTIETNIE